MLRTRISAIVALAALAPFPALAEEPLLKSGRWEITTQMDLGGIEIPPGMPSLPGMQPMTHVSCLSEEEAKQVGTPLMPPENAKCTVSDYTKNGNKIRFTAKCDARTILFDGEIQSPESYGGKLTMKDPSMPEAMVMNFKGKRTPQACSEAELAADARHSP